MKLRNIFKALSPLPPLAQGPVGRSDDKAAFERPEPGFLQTLLGYGSDHRIYEMDAADQKRLRPIYLKSERTIRNEKIAAERARRRGTDTPVPVSFTAGDPPSADPAPYSLESGFPEMPQEARKATLQRGFGGEAYYGASASSLVSHGEPPPAGGSEKSDASGNSGDDGSQKATGEIASTAAWLSGGLRWRTIAPRGDSGRRG